jgi:hypothetical protein
MIKIWRSFSCNNSTSSRLIGRFTDPALAQATRGELATLFADLEDRNNSALQAMARIYGFDWADGGYGETGPQVFVDEAVLIVHLDYGLGLGPGVPAYLGERGAQVEPESSADIQVSLLFRAAPGVDPRLDEELAVIATQLADRPNGVVDAFRAPWVREQAGGKLAYFRDAGTVGLFFPIAASDLVQLRAWLAAHAIENPVVRIEELADQALFDALAAARCAACDGALEYLDPRLHDIDSAQLVCRPCGGLYELSTFLPVK